MTLPVVASVRAVGVLVPARDEEHAVGRCLDAVLAALRRLPSDIVTAVCLVVDRSRDRTAGVADEIVRRRRDRCSIVDVRVNECPVPIGAVRNLAAYTVLGRLAAVPPHRTWLLSTDADSTVPPDWAQRHVELADDRVDAVAGGVRPDLPVTTWLHDPAGLYAANLGLRAAPFLRLGGFPVVPYGEDAAIVQRFREAGHRVVVEPGLAVTTSTRTHGRASGGLAEFLRHREQRPAAVDTAG